MGHRFQVDLKGVIELLSNHLYSEPAVFVRELLQNAVDALSAQAMASGARTGGVRAGVRRATDDAPASLWMEDEGIGLSEEDMHRFLATIGESSKRGTVPARGGDFIGQFGVGLLSCFVVSEEIRVVSRHCRDGVTSEVLWRGRADGTYDVEPRGAVTQPAGTRVELVAKPGSEEFFDAERLGSLLSHYGALLPWPISLVTSDGERPVSGEAPPWLDRSLGPTERGAAVLEYGRRLFGQEFLDWVPLRSTAGDVQGVAYVLPFAPNLATRRTHRVYLKGMLLSDQASDVLPDWTFFVKAVIDARALSPTASREALRDDEQLALAREELGAMIRAWLLHVARHEPERLQALLRVHHLAIKTLAAEDDDVLGTFMPFLPFETSSGTAAFGELAKRQQPLRFATTVEEFRQMAPVAAAQGLTLVNAGYVYDLALLERARRLLGVQLERVVASGLTEYLEELGIEERERSRSFFAAAASALAPFGCEVALKKFRPDELPVLYATGEDAEFRRSVRRTREVSGDLWAGLLDDLAGVSEGQAPVVCFNLRNPLIAKLSLVDDSTLVTRTVELLYVNALLLGHHPLAERERALLTTGLYGLVEWGLEARSRWLQ